MKVIERKDPTPGWPRQVTCEDSNGSGRGCGSKLEVDAADVTQPEQRDGDNGWFRCPVCHQVNYLTQADTRSAARAYEIRRSGQQFP